MTGGFRMISLDRKQVDRTPLVACIGYFDGLHKGHQALIHATIEEAKKRGCASGLITFSPDPWVTLKGIRPNEEEHLTTMQQRIALAHEYGIDKVFVLDFSKKVAALSPDDFLIRILGQLNLQCLVCGYDFHFGAFGKGDGSYLKANAPFAIIEVGEVSEDGIKISSTRITELVKAGEMEKAEQLMGRPFETAGTVVHGLANGHKLGFPTANLSCPVEYVRPRGGVYAGYFIHNGEKYKAMINFGHNPTVVWQSHMSLEANILDFEGDLYGQKASLQFKKYLRPEKAFDSIDDLIAQLKKDQETVRELLA